MSRLDSRGLDLVCWVTDVFDALAFILTVHAQFAVCYIPYRHFIDHKIMFSMAFVSQPAFELRSTPGRWLRSGL